MNKSGEELYGLWKESGLSQRALAKKLNVGFNVLHGRIFRHQKETMVKSKPVGLRGVVFDIEVCDFEATSVHDLLVCVSFLPLDAEEPYTLQLSHKQRMGKGADKSLLKEVIDELQKYDILVGHWISGFDLNWLNTRRHYHGITFPKQKWLYYDTYSAARRMAIKTRKSLGNLAASFGLKGEKTRIFRPDWTRVLSTDEDEFDEAMSEITYHCEQDVILNKQLFDVLWPLDISMVNLPLYKRM